MVKRLLVVSGLACCLVGCPTIPELGVMFDPASLTVPSGQVVSVYAVASGGVGPLYFDWEWTGPEGTGYGDGPIFRVTPDQNFVGPVEHIIHVTVSDSHGQVATAEKAVTIGSPSSAGSGFSWNRDGLLCTGGVKQADGSIKVEWNKTLFLDCSGAFQGGVAPFDIYWIDNGVIVGRGLTCQISSGQVGQRNLVLRIVDSRGVMVEYTIVIVVIVVENPPAANPTIDLKVDGQDGPVTVSEGHQLQITWTSTNARRVDVSASPPTSKFEGERALSTQTPELATLPSGSYVLMATATGAAGTTSSSDSVVVTVGPDHTADRLRLISVVYSPPGPFAVGERVTIIIKHTGTGTINYLLSTSDGTRSKPAETDGETRFDYVWPRTVLCDDPEGQDCSSKFWPDDNLAERIEVEAIVNNAE